MEDAVFAELKQDRDAKIKTLTEEVTEALTEQLTAMVGEETDIDALIGDIIYKFQKMTVRRMIPERPQAS